MPFSAQTVLALTNTDPAIAAPAVANPHNGTGFGVDFRKPSDYIGADAKIVLNGDRFDLEATMVYQLWVLLGRPTAVAECDMSEETTSKTYWNMCRLIARSNLYATAIACGDIIAFRRSDTITPAIDNAVAARLARHIRRIYSHIASDGDARSDVGNQGQLTLWSFVVNAAHRRMFEDHSFYSDEARDPKSVQSKLFSVAGRNKKAFAAWMMEGARAHDDNHHLSTVSLHNLAMAVAGKSSARASPARPESSPGAGDAVPAVGNVNYTYAGDAIGTKTLSELFYGGLACEERYPPGELGKAAMIVGLEMLQAMVYHICGKLKVTGVEPVMVNVGKVSKAIKAETFPTEVVRRIDVALDTLMSTTCGYVIEAGLMERESNLAFENHADRRKGAKARGVALAKVIDDLKPHNEAVVGQVAALVADVAAAIQSVGDMQYHPAAGMPLIDVADTDEVKADDIKVVAAEDETTATLRMMRALQSGGAGDAFVDARSD